MSRKSLLIVSIALNLCATGAAAQVAQSEPSLEAIAEIGTELDIVRAQQAFIMCFLLAADAAAKASCSDGLSNSAMADIAAAAQVRETQAADGDDHTVGNDVRAFQTRIRSCVAQLEAYVRSERDGNAADTFATECSEDEIRQQLQETGDSLRQAFNSCRETSEGLRNFYNRYSSLPILDLITNAQNVENLSDDARECINNVGEAAESARDSIQKFETALASTLAFCTAVPEPYSCGIFAAIQLLMALFESGGGGGSGDGSGPNDGEGQQASTGGGGEPAPSPYTDPPQGENPPLNTELEEGHDCTVERQADDLICGGDINAPNYFGGARLVSSDGSLTQHQLSQVNMRLDGEYNNLDRYFADSKMVFRSGNTIQFCVAIMPGLGAVFDASRQQQADESEILTAILLTPSGADGDYDVQLDHSGRGCR